VVELAQFSASVADPEPAGARLRAMPNPFTGSTRVAFELRRAQPVQLTIHDPAGRRVETLVDGVLPAGSHVRIWDGRDRAGRPGLPGLYYYRLRCPEQDVVGRLVLLR
jgi:hypothetical protein